MGHLLNDNEKFRATELALPFVKVKKNDEKIAFSIFFVNISELLMSVHSTVVII